MYLSEFLLKHYCKQTGMKRKSLASLRPNAVYGRTEVPDEVVDFMPRLMQRQRFHNRHGRKRGKAA